MKISLISVFSLFLMFCFNFINISSQSEQNNYSQYYRQDYNRNSCLQNNIGQNTESNIFGQEDNCLESLTSNDSKSNKIFNFAHKNLRDYADKLLANILTIKINNKGSANILFVSDFNIISPEVSLNFAQALVDILDLKLDDTDNRDKINWIISSLSLTPLEIDLLYDIGIGYMRSCVLAKYLLDQLDKIFVRDFNKIKLFIKKFNKLTRAMLVKNYFLEYGPGSNNWQELQNIFPQTCQSLNSIHQALFLDSDLSFGLTITEIVEHEKIYIDRDKFLNLLGFKIKNIDNLSNYTDFQNLHGLILDNNNISNIGNSFENLKSLKSLCLRHNYIQEIGENAFNGLKSLEKLDLGENFIETVSPKAFLDLSKLKELLLDYNKLAYLHRDAFKNQNQLEILFLSKNNFERFEPGIFRNLKNIEILNLSKNRLAELSINSFRAFDKVKLKILLLEKLKLSDKDMADILKYFADSQITFKYN